MFDIIKKMFSKKEEKNMLSVLDNQYDILISYDKEKNDVSLCIDYESILEKAKPDFDQDAVSIAKFLYTICNNKALLASLILDNLSQYKEIATKKASKYQDSDSLLFANNIISNLESILLSSKTTNKDEPLIKPIRVFHNAS